MACGPLRKKRYINPKIELELVEFKKEIEEKFAKSAIKSFAMPRKPVVAEIQDPNASELTVSGIFN